MLSNVQQILLYENQLTGTIPNLSALDGLRVFDASTNALTGSIPSTWPTGILSLHLNNNNLSGSIPAELGNFNFSSIKLNDNSLSGCYDPNFQNLCTVSPLFFDNNSLLPAGGDFSQFCTNNQYGICGGPWDCDGSYIDINDNPLPNGELKMEKYIQSGGIVQSPNLLVTFLAKDSIVLKSNFEVKSNSVFEVVLDDCSGN